MTFRSRMTKLLVTLSSTNYGFIITRRRQDDSSYMYDENQSKAGVGGRWRWAEWNLKNATPLEY